MEEKIFKVRERIVMPIRVLHVVTYMGRGGLETMLMNYYRNIDREKVQFDFLTHRDFEADYDQEIRSLGGKIYHLPKLNPFSLSYLKKLNQFFLDHPEYKIVHSHLDCMAGIPLKYAKANRVPIRIAHAHNNNQAKDKKYLLKLLFKQNITKYATHLFACSSDAGQWMFNGKKYSILNNAIDARKYSFNEEIRYKMRTSFDIEQDTFVIGHVGRFAPQKNHEFLIDVFAEIKKRTPNSKLILVGIGELQDKIKGKVISYGLTEDVIFTGLREDVPEILQALDVFVFPSLFEGLPVAVIEAQAAGVPCVISDKVPIECEKVKGLVHQVDLSCGCENWTNKVLEFSNGQRRDTNQEIISSGFDIRNSATKLESFYLELYSKLKEI